MCPRLVLLLPVFNAQPVAGADQLRVALAHV